jgi:protein-S-isoprenylcysteine O-methyltransferase Ste14
MMNLSTIEFWFRWAGAAAILVLTAIALIGFGRGRRRVQGRTTGRGLRSLQLPLWAYGLLSLAYAGLSYLLWRPVLLSLSPSTRATVLAVGALLYFPSVALIVWARQTLGKMYNISTSAGVQLYADHRLITCGPFAIVRHPMYTGTLLAGLGALLIYRTWTIVFILAHCAVFFVRAGREEEALAAEFGTAWEDYRQRVPGWVPRLGCKSVTPRSQTGKKLR